MQKSSDSKSKISSAADKVKKALSGEKKFEQVTMKKPGVLKDAKSEIARIEKKLNSDRSGQGYGIWAIKDGKTIKVVISKGSPPSNYAMMEGQTLGEQILDKGKFDDKKKWDILESCATDD